jgi:hypothetical protein
MIRNRIYKELNEKKNARLAKERAEADGQTVTASAVTFSADSIHTLLIYDHRTVESFETVFLLNYFGFPVELEMDNHWHKARKEMGFGTDDSYPLLIINSSDPDMPPVDISSKEAILAYLFKQGFIGNYK